MLHEGDDGHPTAERSPRAPAPSTSRRHRELGTSVLMFVRHRRTDGRGLAAPYTCLGLVDYVSHTGERPMAITWRLRAPMPASVFAAVRLTAA